MAMTPQDIFFRRTRLGFLDIEVIYKIYVDVMEVFAEEFKWTDKVRK
jgi:glycerol-3-phosphate dehydrogenase